MARGDTRADTPAATRRDQPWLFVEFITIAAMYLNGAMISEIAVALRRPKPQVRAILFGDAA